MKRSCIAILLVALLPFCSLAQQNYPRDFDICWTNPSQYVDGSLIEAGDLETIRIEVYRQNETVPSFVANFPDNGEGARQCETIAGAIPNPGTYFAVGFAIVVGGNESDASTASQPQKFTGKPLPIVFD